MSEYALQKVLKAGTRQHRIILDALEARLSLSRQEMSKRYSAWEEQEKIMQAYIPTSDTDEERKARRRKGTPEFTTIFVPYSYAQLMTAHTYWASVFLSRNPVYQFSARHGEPMDRVQSVEALMDYQRQVGGHMPPLYCWGKDKLQYGIGILGYYWDQEVHQVSRFEMQPRTAMGVPIPGTERRVKITEELTGYMGNRLFNVRPQDWFPDPRVALKDFQKGEFCARYFTEAWTSVLDKQEDGQYYNVDRVAEFNKRPSGYSWANAGFLEREMGHSDDVSGLPDPSHQIVGGGEGMKDTGYLEGHEMCVRLIPTHWGLGESRKSEIWVFRFVSNCALISARPLGCIHDKYPFEVLEFDIGGYSLFKRSLIEYVQPMSDVMTWLFNTHFYNIRKELNGFIVYDPLKVHEKDLLSNEPGKRVRLRPNAYGTDVRQALAQIPTVDVTREHIRDIQIVRLLAQEILGINENIMGQTQQGGRKTATEVRHSTSFGVNRMKNHAEWDSALGWAPLAQALLQNTQQYYDMEREFKIIGDLMKEGPEGYRKITPRDIAGFYDFVPVDGTLPVDKFAQANLWRELLAQFRGLPPQAAAQFDIVAIISHIMQLSGAVNVNRFKVQALSPEAIQRGAASGNIVPASGATKGGPGTAAGGPPPSPNPGGYA